jgi:hypothetical protein
VLVVLKFVELSVLKVVVAGLKVMVPLSFGSLVDVVTMAVLVKVKSVVIVPKSELAVPESGEVVDEVAVDNVPVDVVPGTEAVVVAIEAGIKSLTLRSLYAVEWRVELVQEAWQFSRGLQLI